MSATLKPAAPPAPVRREASQPARIPRPSRRTAAARSLRRHWQLYLLVIVPLAYFVIFKYIPISNAVIAFKNYSPIKGPWGSDWVGFKNFELFFANPVFWTLVKNTFILAAYTVLASFPIPIILAIALNEIRNGWFKKTVQLVTYAPYFISTVVVVSMTILVLSPRIGFVERRDRAVRHPGGRLPRRSGLLPAYLRLVRRLADHRVLGGHLPGRAGRHRPGAARVGQDRRRQPAAADPARRPARASCRPR